MNDEFKLKKIAVVGVSQDASKYGYKIFKDLVEFGCNVQAVGVRGGEVLGRKIYKSIKELEAVPEQIITVVPPAGTEQIVEQSKELGVKEIWMQPGSESETAIKNAKSYGMHVTYNACFMVANGLWKKKNIGLHEHIK
jgi:predicted CoA-binding protein